MSGNDIPEATATPPADPTPVPARSGRWTAVVAAGVLAVGGAGLAVANDDAPRVVDRGTSLAPAAPAPADAARDEAGAATPSTAGPARNSAAVDMPTAEMSMPAFGSWHTVFTAGDLGDAPDVAHAWTVDPTAAYTPEKAAALATALGVAGDPVQTDWSWRVGPEDWSGPVVELSNDAFASFYYSDPAFDYGAASADDATLTDTLTALMTVAGVDPAQYTITVEHQDYSPAYAQAVPLLGASAGSWSLSMTADGVSSVNGSLATPVDLGPYDVVGARTAVDRLNDPRFGATYDYGVMPLAARSGVDDTAGVLEDQASDASGSGQSSPPSAGTDVLPAPEITAPDVAVDPVEPAPDIAPAPEPIERTPVLPGTAIDWPVENVTITGATLTTTVTYQADGSPVIVPAYSLSDAEGRSWTVIAVTDAHLNFAAR